MMLATMVILFAVFCITSIPLDSDAQDYDNLFAGGTGTEADPWLISNQTELKNINNAPYTHDKHYRLISDINISGTWTSLCKDGFNGTLDGAFYSIGTISGTGGLFWTIDHRGVVKNINVDVNINTSGLAGAIADYNYGTIDNCISNGKVVVVGENRNTTRYAGGIAGIGYGTSSITSCTSFVSVEAWAHPGIAGGVVGLTKTGVIIENCSIEGHVIAGATHFVPGSSSTAEAGGVVGRTEGSANITNCIVYGSVKADSSNAGIMFVNLYGGLVGHSSDALSISNSFFISGKVSGSWWRGEEAVDYVTGNGRGTTNNARPVSEIDATSTGLFASWSNDLWSINEGDHAKTRWISGISLEGTQPIAHGGVIENVEMTLSLDFNTGGHEIQKAIIKKANPNATMLTVNYGEYSTTVQLNVIQLDSIELTESPDNRVFTIGAVSKALFSIDKIWEDGFRCAATQSDFTISSPSEVGKGVIVIKCNSLTAEFIGYFHDSDSYGVLINNYGNSEPNFITCEKGASIQLTKSNLDGYTFKGWYSDKDCNILVTTAIDFTPSESITLYEGVESSKDGGILDSIIGFFKGIWDWIRSLFG